MKLGEIAGKTKVWFVDHETQVGRITLKMLSNPDKSVYRITKHYIKTGVISMRTYKGEGARSRAEQFFNDTLKEEIEYVNSDSFI